MHYSRCAHLGIRVRDRSGILWRELRFEAQASSRTAWGTKAERAPVLDRAPASLVYRPVGERSPDEAPAEESRPDCIRCKDALCPCPTPSPSTNSRA